MTGQSGKAAAVCCYNRRLSATEAYCDNTPSISTFAISRSTAHLLATSVVAIVMFVSLPAVMSWVCRNIAACIAACHGPAVNMPSRHHCGKGGGSLRLCDLIVHSPAPLSMLQSVHSYTPLASLVSPAWSRPHLAPRVTVQFAHPRFYAPLRLPAVVLPLRGDLAVRQLHPRLAVLDLGLALRVLADARRLFLEDDLEICGGGAC